MSRLYIGIDLGKEGEIALLDDEGKYLDRFLMPKIGNEYDLKGFDDIFKAFSPLDCHVVLEDVHAIHGSSAKATWSFSGGKHILMMGLVSNGIPYTLVQPKAWQKEMWQGIPEQRKPSKKDKNGKLRKGAMDTKAMSLMASKRLYPSIDFRKTERSKIAHDGIVDAILMAGYCYRKFK